MASSLGTHPGIRAILDAAAPWHTLEHRAQATSALDVALALARDGARPGLVVVADRQSAGRGRAGRPWQDGPTAEASLLVAALVDPPGVATGLVPLVTGVAVADVTERLGIDATLKWPNDVLVGSAKCAGILAERHAVDGLDRLLIGIGIDVDWRGADRTGEAAGWTSLAEAADRDLDRGEVLADLLRALADRLEEVQAARDVALAAYRGRCSTLGQEVEVALPGDRHVSGRAIDVDADGHLVVDTGRERIVISVGDVVHLRGDVPDGSRPP